MTETSTKHKPLVVTPHYSREAREWQWKYVHVAQRGKMLGLYASVDLPKYTRIPYFGSVILGKRAIDEWFEKIYAIYKDKPRRLHKRLSYRFCPSSQIQIDACPIKIGTVGGDGLYIAGMCNEPDRKMKANAVFRGGSKPTLLEASPSRNGHEPLNAYAWIVLAKSVRAGEEVTVHYGNDYARQGYKAGARATLT